MSIRHSSINSSCVDLERRRFLKTAATACVACSALVVLQSCGVADSLLEESGGDTADSVSVDADGSVVLTLADEPGLATVGGFSRKVATGFNGGRDFLVVRIGDEDYRAMTTRCTHAGGTLRNPDGGLAICRSHGAEFGVDADNFGQWLGGQPATDINPLSVALDAESGTLVISEA